MNFYRTAFSLLILLSVTYFNSCSKTVDQPQNSDLDSIPDNNPIPEDTITAFTFNTCSARISGKFYPGVALTQNEYIDYGVNVTNPGPWKFSIDTVNGFTFSDSGVFTTTGNQYMRVHAAGTPQKHGNFVFVATENPLRVTTVPVRQMDSLPGEMVPAGVYFEADIDGVHYSLKQDSTEPWHATYFYPGDTAYFYTTVRNINSDRYFSVYKYGMLNYDASTPQDFFDFFKPGVYPYATGCSNNWKGIMIAWQEKAYKSYSSSIGMAQEGSSFQITGMDTGYVDDWNYYVKVRMRFNCTLYRQGWPDAPPIELKNGEMVHYYIRQKMYD